VGTFCQKLSREQCWQCGGAGCYSLNLTYDVPIQQIEALIAMSDTCEQEIKFECKLAPLKNTAFGVKFGWWTNQREEKKYYFDGADEESEVCDINHNGGVCNCDMSLVPLWNSDSGRITNKNSLPIKGFYYGGFFSEHQAGRITIGKLKCSGQSTDSTDLVSTCSSLKKSGLSSNGFYLTKDSAEDDVSVNYCQLSSPGYKEEKLRREEVGLDLFSKMEEFTFVSYTKASGRHSGSNYNRNGQNVRFYDMTSIQFEPKTSRYFDITDRYFIAKQTGLYAFSSEHAGIFLSNKWVSLADTQNSVASMTLIKKGEMINFKIDQYTSNVKGSTLTVFKMR